MKSQMTTEKAIRILRCMQEPEAWEPQITEAAFEALDASIRALEILSVDGCRGCEFEPVEEWEMPCKRCKRNMKDYWRKKE